MKNYQALLPRLLLLLPAFLLALFFLLHPFEFHSDDLWYWEETLRWRNAFQAKPFFSVLYELHHFLTGRPSYHPLLGVPFLWATNSVPLSMRLVGLSFLTVATGSAFAVFKKFKLSELSAALGAITVCTLPYLLSMGRAFLPELPFCALSLLALALLVRERWAGFALAYGVALLCRPLEGLLLLPFFFFFTLLGDKLDRDKWKYFALSTAAALALMAIAFMNRMAPVYHWLSGTMYPQSGVQALGPGKLGLENFLFVKNALYLSFGITGILLIAVSFFLAFQQKRHRRQAWAQTGIFLSLCLVFGIISTFEHWATRGYFGRYSLSFVIFFLLFAVLLIHRFGNLLLRYLSVGPFLAMNLYVCVAAILGPASQVRMSTAPLAHSFGQFHFNPHPAGADLLANALRELVPPKANAYILVAGRDPDFFHHDLDIVMRLLDGWPGIKFRKTFPAQYQAEIFERKLTEGSVDLVPFQLEAVVFARNELYPGKTTKAYPSQSLVDALEKNKPEVLGLKLARKIQWERSGHRQEIEIYLPKRSELQN